MLLPFLALAVLPPSDPITCGVTAVEQDIVDHERVLILTFDCSDGEGDIIPQSESEQEFRLVINEQSIRAIVFIVDQWLENPSDFEPPETTEPPIVIQD